MMHLRIIPNTYWTLPQALSALEDLLFTPQIAPVYQIIILHYIIPQRHLEL